MPYSDSLELVKSVALALVTGGGGSPPVIIEAATGGGNNRLYPLVDARGRRFALKAYARPGGDQRDRLGTEFGALRFLNDHDVRQVPTALAIDRKQGYALYDWVESVAPQPATASDIDQALALVARLVRLGEQSAARFIGPASASGQSAGRLLRQLAQRRRRYDQPAAQDPVLASFLATDFDPRAARVETGLRDSYRRRRWSLDADLPQSRLVLSPSDFGFHNALKRPDGKLVFIDFEYFGWDDPAKLTADFLLHPGMTLAPALKARFRDGAAALFGAKDPDYPARLETLYPLIGLIWCMILLNEYVPENWSRRHFAGVTEDSATITRRQLEKARRSLAAVPDFMAGALP
jgi:hypothetical protein